MAYRIDQKFKFPKFRRHNFRTNSMLRNYFINGLRRIWSNKLHSCINILGLALGIAVVLLIGGYVVGELQVNKSIKDVERIHCD